jgi:hypothetical protein
MASLGFERFCSEIRLRNSHRTFSNPHPCASSRFIPFVRSSLSTFTHFQHRTARVFLHSLPLLSSSFSHTLAFPNAHPNAGKAVFVSRSVLFRKNISARVKCTPYGRPCIYRSLTSSFALQWVLTHCRSLVLLHTLSPSSLAAISSPQTPL